jgi:hypothetical protein
VQGTPAAGGRIIGSEHRLADRLVLRFGRNGGRRVIAHNRTFVWFPHAHADSTMLIWCHCEDLLPEILATTI